MGDRICLMCSRLINQTHIRFYGLKYGLHVDPWPVGKVSWTALVVFNEGYF